MKNSEKLTNIIEAILFVSGKAVAFADIADKLGVTTGEVRKALEELKAHYGEEGGIQVLIFNMLYAVEETAQARLGLLLLPSPVQSVWLGKGMAGVILLTAAQCIFIPAVFVFLGQHAGEAWPTALLGILLGNVGMAAAGSLLGALSVGRSGRESLLSIVLFPLYVALVATSHSYDVLIGSTPLVSRALRVSI